MSQQLIAGSQVLLLLINRYDARHFKLYFCNCSIGRCCVLNGVSSTNVIILYSPLMCSVLVLCVIFHVISYLYSFVILVLGILCLSPEDINDTYVW